MSLSSSTPDNFEFKVIMPELISSATSTSRGARARDFDEDTLGGEALRLNMTESGKHDGEESELNEGRDKRA